MVDGDDAHTADQQLSLLYGHFPYLGSRTKAMDDSFEELVLESSESGGSPSSAPKKLSALVGEP
jgi:hypothetical protein